MKLGNNKAATDDVWSVLQFECAPEKSGDLARYVDAASGEVRVQLLSGNATDDARVDQEELVLMVREPPSLGACRSSPPTTTGTRASTRCRVDPHSDDYVAALGANDARAPGLRRRASGRARRSAFPWTSVAAGQPLVDVSFYYDDSDPGPYPIPPDAPIEGGPGRHGDRHVLVVDQDACLLYEIFDAHPSATASWDAGSGAVFDLNSNALRPDGWTSADAAGFAILPGLVRYEEVAAGEIAHALRFTGRGHPPRLRLAGAPPRDLRRPRRGRSHGAADGPALPPEGLLRRLGLLARRSR